MRVERFALFFPPLVAKRKRGETEYAIGSIPLGGYVKITGMNPAEDIPPEHAHRAYYRQPVWKRIVVIGAGPAVNIVLAFAIMAGVFMARGPIEPPLVVGNVEANLPAAGKLQKGDKVLAVDGKPPDRQLQRAAQAGHRDRRQAQGRRRVLHGRPQRPDGRRSAATRSSTTSRSRRATGSASATTRTRCAPTSGPVAVLGPGAGRDVVRHVHHGQPHRADLRLREAQGDRQRRRRLRDDAGGDLDRLGDRAVRARADLASASASSTCSRSCRSTAATSSGRWPRRCAARRSRSPSWSGPGSWASRSC